MRITYFQTIADRSPLPIVLLRVPNRITSLEEVAELASHPNITGILDAVSGEVGTQMLIKQTSSISREVTVTSTFAAVTTRMKRAAEAAPPRALVSVNWLVTSATAIAEPTPLVSALRTRTKSVGFQILNSHSVSLLTTLNAGATAISPSFAAAAPQACYEVFAAWKDSDQPLAEEKQARLVAAAALTKASPAALKYACDLNGYFGGYARLPHLPLTAAQREEIERQMKELRN